jgi:fimbrial isopeptide formation D2 family protein
VQRVVPLGAPGAGSAVLAVLEGQRWVAAPVPLNVTITTGASGQTKISGLSNGYYLITELGSDKIEEATPAFLVALPTVIPEPDGIVGQEPLQLYDVYCYPKNTNVDISKVIDYKDGFGGKHDTVNIGDKVSWLITADIPSKISTALSYQIIDSFDEGLSYVTGSLKLVAIGKDAKTYPLLQGSHYTVTITPPKAKGGGVITVDFSAAGRAFLQGKATVEMRLQTIVLPNAALQKPLYNGAELSYRNAGQSHITRNTKNPKNPKDRGPEVHLGGVRILKKDAKSKKALSGAVFKIVRKASADYKADFKKYGYLKRSGKDYSVTTNRQGQAAITGLSYGKAGDDHTKGYSDYWLVETKAPAGYKLLTSPLVIRINATSYKTGVYKYSIYNKKSPLPVIPKPIKTGDGLNLTLIALLLVAAAYLLHKTSRARAPDRGGDKSRE